MPQMTDTNQSEEKTNEQSASLLGGEEEKATAPETLLYKEEQPEEKKEEANPPEEKKQAPEEYDLKFEEGQNLDQELLNNYKNLAKEADLTQDQAQKIASFYGEYAKAALEKIQAEEQKTRSEWVEKVKATPNYKETLGYAQRAITRFAPEGAKELLTKSWLGDHPDIIEFLSKVGRAISEDPVHLGRNTGPVETKRPEDIFYDKMPRN